MLMTASGFGVLPVLTSLALRVGVKRGIRIIDMSKNDLRLQLRSKRHEGNHASGKRVR